MTRYGKPDGDADKRAYAGIVAEAFAGDFDTFDDWVRAFGNGVRLLKDGGVQAGLVFYEMGQYFGGRGVPTWGIAGVAVRPEQRAKGLARELMHASLRENFENGPPISTLYPAAPKLYRELGWEFAGTRTSCSFRLAELPVLEHDLVLRPGSEADHELMARLYSRRYSGENGCLDRNAQIWQRTRRAPRETPLHCYIVERDGVAEGYVTYTQKRTSADSFRYNMLARDLVFTTPAAAKALVSLFARNRSVADRMQFFASPEDSLLQLLMRTQELHIEQRMYWMLRIVRVTDALKARGYSPHVTAKASVVIADDTLPGNAGACTLELADGKMNVTPGGSGPILDVRGLACLYSASLGPGQLRAAGLLRGDDTQDSSLAAMFAGPAPWMPDFF